MGCKPKTAHVFASIPQTTGYFQNRKIAKKFGKNRKNAHEKESKPQNRKNKLTREVFVEAIAGRMKEMEERANVIENNFMVKAFNKTLLGKGGFTTDVSAILLL